MHRIAVAVAGAVVPLLVLAGSAAAQPGQTPVAPPGPPPVAPPPYTYAPQPPPPPQLTLDEQELLAHGEISDGEHIGGGVLSIFPGFGVGQAVQGRWSDKGWMFTLGDVVGSGLIIYGISKNDCFLSFDPCEDQDDGVPEFLVGLATLTVFRVWEIIDAFAAPPGYNRRVRALRARLGYPPPMYSRPRPFVLPSHDGDGAIAGVALRF